MGVCVCVCLSKVCCVSFLNWEELIDFSDCHSRFEPETSGTKIEQAFIY